jgi:large subunit ribosomal protein L28
MGMKCANCGKGVMYGHNVSHSKRRTRKIFKPNLHETRVLIGGQRRRMRLCTKCLRTYRRVEALQKNPIKEVIAAVSEEPSQAAV